MKPESDSSHLPEALRVLRTFNDMSATELSGKLGISRSYLSEIERGKKRIDMDLLDKYSRVFRIRSSTIMLLGESIKAERGDVRHWLIRRLGNFLIEVEREGTRALPD